MEEATSNVDHARAYLAQAVADVRAARERRRADPTNENFNALLRALNESTVAQMRLSLETIIARSAARRAARELRRSA